MGTGTPTIDGSGVEFRKLMHVRPEPSQFGGSGSEEDRIENAHKFDLNKVKKVLSK